MRYVKIKAKNYNEAMMKLKMEHGEDAIPISHKYIKEGGMFNSKIFAKDVVELTAAIQDKKVSARLAPRKKSRLISRVGEKDGIGPQDTITSEMLARSARGTTLPDAIEGSPCTSDTESATSDQARAAREARRSLTELSPGDGSRQREHPANEFDSMKKFEKEFHEIRRP